MEDAEVASASLVGVAVGAVNSTKTSPGDSGESRKMIPGTMYTYHAFAERLPAVHSSEHLWILSRWDPGREFP